MPPGLQRHAETAAMPFSLRGCRTRLSHHRRARRRLDVRPRNLEKFQWLGTFERTAAGCVTARAPSVPSRSSVTGALWIRRGSNPPIFRSDPLRPDSRISDSIEARQTRIPRSERATSLSSDTGPPSTAKSSPRAARWRWRASDQAMSSSSTTACATRRRWPTTSSRCSRRYSRSRSSSQR